MRLLVQLASTSGGSNIDLGQNFKQKSVKMSSLAGSIPLDSSRCSSPLKTSTQILSNQTNSSQPNINENFIYRDNRHQLELMQSIQQRPAQIGVQYPARYPSSQYSCCQFCGSRQECRCVGGSALANRLPISSNNEKLPPQAESFDFEQTSEVTAVMEQRYEQSSYQVCDVGAPHQSRRQEYQQQVSSHSEQQRMISDSSSDMIVDNRLAYNYNNHGACSNNWSMTVNVSSRAQNTQVFEGSIFRDGDSETIEANQDAYDRFPGSSSNQKIELKDTGDFNNNNHLQNQPQNAFSLIESDQSINRTQDSYCQQSSTSNQGHIFPSTDYYAACDEPSAPYEIQSNHQYSHGNFSTNQANHLDSYEVIPLSRGAQANPDSTETVHDDRQQHLSSYDQQLRQSGALAGGQKIDSMDNSLIPMQSNVFQPTENCQIYKLSNSVTSSSQQTHEYQDAQYTVKSDRFVSLQMNCDNYNQVSMSAKLSDNSNLSINKSRSFKSRRGRPRKKGLRSKNKVNGKLWEFIRDLLLNDRTNPSFIRWERREDGVFKFVQSDKVAKMWGERKQNPKMTYEKLSRAMRYYYKNKVLLPVFGRRLVYKFGPNATGWMLGDGPT